MKRGESSHGLKLALQSYSCVVSSNNVVAIIKNQKETDFYETRDQKSRVSVACFLVARDIPLEE